MREALSRNFGLLEHQRPELHNVVAQGDTAIVPARDQGRYRPAEREYDVPWVQL